MNMLPCRNTAASSNRSGSASKFIFSVISLTLQYDELITLASLYNALSGLEHTKVQMVAT